MVKGHDPWDSYEADLLHRINELDQLARKEGYSINRSRLKKQMIMYGLNRSYVNDRSTASQDRITLTSIVNELENQMFGEPLTIYNSDYDELYIPKPSRYARGNIEDALGLRKKKVSKSKSKRKVTKKKSCGCK